MIVGQKIYLETRGITREEEKIQECTISKVGRKYFEVQEKPRERFEISTMEHDGKGWVSRYKCYISIKEIEDKNSAQKHFDYIRQQFSSYVNTYPLEMLEEIVRILSKYE